MKASRRSFIAGIAASLAVAPTTKFVAPWTAAVRTPITILGDSLLEWRIGEVIIFKRGITSAERMMAENYLKNKWGDTA